jgi:hypothetical protein
MHLRTSAVALGAALVLGLAACGSDDDATTSTAAPAAAAKPLVQVDALNGESTAISLTPAFAGSLAKLKAQGFPLGSAKISRTGRSTYPITGGKLTYSDPKSTDTPLQGVIEHSGSGLRLTNAKSKVDLRDFVVDVDGLALKADITVDGKAVSQDTPIFALDASTMKPKLDDATGVALLKGFTVRLEPATAELLNTSFGTQGVSAGEVVGTATVTVDTK